jgi:hypothetical protein
VSLIVISEFLFGGFRFIRQFRELRIREDLHAGDGELLPNVWRLIKMVRDGYLRKHQHRSVIIAKAPSIFLLGLVGIASDLNVTYGRFEIRRGDVSTANLHNYPIRSLFRSS